MKKSLVLALSLVASGCISYKIPTEQIATNRDANEMQMSFAQNSLYDFVPMKKEQLQTGDVRWLSWYLLGNDDGGIFGEYDCFKDKKEPCLKTFLEWQLRNPLHNATRRIGDNGSGKSITEYLLFGLSNKDAAFFRNTKKNVFDEGKNNLFLSFHNYKPYIHTRLYVPFMHRYFQSYLGWRKGGKLGACIRLRKENL